MTHTMHKEEKGFTLIELLIVIGIIGFLAAAVLVAVDPVKRIQDARDARRFSETNGLLNAILTKQVDDRAVYTAGNDAPIVTSQTNAQVIVTDTSGIECDAASAGVTNESYPGCNKVLDTAARAIGSPTSSAAVVTGTGFNSNVRVGDRLVLAADGTSPCTVLSIQSNTQLTCTASVSPAYAGTPVVALSKNCVVNLSDTFTGVGSATSALTAVTGTTTNFSSQVSVGDTLTSASGGTCLVTVVGSATAITCSVAPSPVFSGTYTITKKNAIVPNYIASIPVDPRGTGETICQTGCTTNGLGITTLGSTNTGYYLQRSNGNRIEVGACDGEQTENISVKR